MAAGASGNGHVPAAEEKGFAAIGVNLNQNSIARTILWPVCLKSWIPAHTTPLPALWRIPTGENQMLGLSDGGVDVTVEGSNIKVSDDILARLDELKQKIISGEIQVPSGA